MSAVGYCYDNAFAESLFASIKCELLPEDGIFESKSEASTSIFDYLGCVYNHNCLHSALGYQSPQNFLTRYFQNQQHPRN
jgi:putative transposase